MKQICVYAASSSDIDTKYIREAELLAQILVKKNISVLYGGGEVGLMGALSNKMVSLGGIIKGAIPQFMVDNGWDNKNVEQIITDSIHERKALFLNSSSLAIALPGGIGTLEELLEAITWRQLGLFPHPIIIINSFGFYDDLLRMLDKCKSERFLADPNSDLYIVVDSAADVEGWL